MTRKTDEYMALSWLYNKHLGKSLRVLCMVPTSVRLFDESSSANVMSVKKLSIVMFCLLPNKWYTKDFTTRKPWFFSDTSFTFPAFTSKLQQYKFSASQRAHTFPEFTWYIDLEWAPNSQMLPEAHQWCHLLMDYTILVLSK